MALSLAEYRQKHPQYDGIDDDTLAKALHGKYYSSMSFEDFSARLSSAPAADRSTPTPEEQNQMVRDKRAAAGLPEFPDDPTDLNNPYTEGDPGVSEYGREVMAASEGGSGVADPLTGKWGREAKRLRDEAAPSKMDQPRDELAVAAMEEQVGPTSSSTSGGVLGLATKKTKQQRVAEQGAIIERMVQSGASPKDYGLTEDQIDSVMEDKTQIEMLKRKEEADAAPDTAEPIDNEGKSYWKALKKKVSHLGEEYFRIQETPEATARVREKQYETLGAMYLDAVSKQNPELADRSDDIIDDVAGKYGISGEMYHRTLATQLDQMFEEEQMTMDGVHEYQRELIADMPQVAKMGDNPLGYIGGKLIENSNSIAYMAAGIATRSPGVLVTLMGSDIYNRTYTDARADGRSVGEAFQDATYSSIVEGATEAIPLVKILKYAKVGNKSRMAKLFNGLAVEGMQEVAAEAAQMAYDIGILDEAKTVGEMMIQLRDAGIIGAIMGGGMAAPSIIAGDNVMNNLNSDVTDAKKRLRSLAMAAQNPDLKVSAADIKKAKQDYADAIKAKGKVILERKKEEAEKKKAKGEKKEAKRKSKLSEKEIKREAAAEAAEKEDQTLTGPVTESDVRMADVLEKASKAELGSEDAEAVQDALDAGYMQITKAGTPVVLPAGTRRIEAVRAAEKGIEDAQETAEPEFTSKQRRKAELSSRVTSKAKDTKAQEKIVDDIMQAEEIEEAYNKRNVEEAERIESQRDEDYQKALDQLTEKELEVAENLAILDEKSISGYQGTRLGDVLRNVMNTLEKEEAAASKALKKKWANMSEQGTLFDVTGVMAKGTALYANAVKIGALRLAKHGAKYSAWTADMIGEFGDSIRPVLARVYHDAKRKVSDIMKLSHEKFATGKRKGQLKFAPKRYAKPGQLRRLRETLRKLAKEGAEGRHWYEKSGKEILRVTGGNKKQARKLAGLFAIYSKGTAVGANTTNALKMWSQFYGKDKIQHPTAGTLAGRFKEQDATAIDWMRSDQADEHYIETFGNKRMEFFVNLMREIDPKNYEVGQGVTVDLWMMRALGFDKESPSDAQYAFASTEIALIAKEMDWENQQAQAAIWVAIKARWEFIQKKAMGRAVREGLAEFNPSVKGKPTFDVLGKDREEQIENEKAILAVFRDEALKVSHAELTKKLEESKADFADNLAKHYATISWEAEPSTKLGSRLNQLSLADKLMMQVEIAELLTNPESGREYLAEWLELLGEDQFVGPGAWNMEIGAAVQNSVLVPVTHKPSKTKTAQAEAAQAMDGYSAILGFLLQQDAVAWHKPFYVTTLKAANGVEILTKTLTPAKTLKLYEEIFNLTHDMGHAPIVMDGAVRVLNFGDIPNREFHKLIAQAADNAGIAGDIEVFQSDGNMIENDWDINKKGESYVESIDNNENPRVQEAFKRAKRKFAKGIAAIYEKYSSEEANARVAARRLRPGTKLPRLAKGNLRFRHFGKADVGVLEVERAGTGIKGAEVKRGAMKVISAYPNKGFAKESGLGDNEYVIDVPKTRMYDANADPMNLKDQAQEAVSFRREKGKLIPVRTILDMNKFEKLIKDAGFAGYYTPKATGNLKGQARFFDSMVVDQRLGELTYVRGKRGSATVYSGNKNIGYVRPTASDKVLRSSPGIQSWSRAGSKTSPTGTYSIADRPRVSIVENEFDEFEVREKNGEVYFATDLDDAIDTARSIHGDDATVVVVDTEGEVITTVVSKTQPARIKVGAEKADPYDVARVSEFLDEWFEITTENPLSPKERIVDEVAAVELRPQSGEIWIDSIRSFDKGTGGGSRSLKAVIELADLHGVTLRLTAKPFDTGGNELDFKSLFQFYQRNGFSSDNRQGKTRTLYHGSPHTFEIFSSEAIGTGEGNAAYGHGLYFAEESRVGGLYQDAIPSPAFAGASYQDDPVAWAAGQLWSGSPDFSVAKTAKKLGASNAVQLVEEGKVLLEESKGHLYEVQIPEDVISSMINWDAPLSDQPSVVQRFAADHLKDGSGQDLYELIATNLGSEEAASAALNEAGITGIRYLDAQSRAPVGTTGGGFIKPLVQAVRGQAVQTSNMVLFDSENIYDVKRDGEEVGGDYDGNQSAVMTRAPKNVTGKFHVWKRPTEKQNAGYGLALQRVKDFTKAFGRRIGLGNFVVVESIEELPDDVYMDIKKIEGYVQINGIFYEDPILGPTIYVVSNNLFDDNMNPSVDYLVEVLMHETIGHFGTRAFLGEKGYNSFMDSIRKAFPAEVKRRGKKMAMTPYGRRLAAEEVFAYFVGESLAGVDLSKVQTSFIDRAMLALKLFLARLGVRNLKQQDLFDMMFRVTDYVRTTPQEVLQKRALQVEKMREALRVRTDKEYNAELFRERTKLTKLEDERNRKDVWDQGDRSLKDIDAEIAVVEEIVSMLESGEYITARFSMNLEKERKADPALDRFMTKIGHGHHTKLTALRDWWQLRKQNLRRAFEIELLDQFAGIKHMERELNILGPESGYMSVRLTAGTDVIIRSAIENAVPAWDKDGSVRMDSDHRGLLEILAPISQNPEMLKAFEAFLVARRARRLKKDNRERLFSREEIGAAFKFIRKNKVHKLFNETAKEMAAYKSKVLDFAMEAGLIDPVSRKLWEHNDHVPFYRVLAENNKKGPFASSRIGSVGKAIHRLKGGEDPLRHPLESIVKNLSMLIEASVKNRATADVVNNFVGTGVVTKAPQAVISKALIPMNQIKDMLHESGVSLDAVGEDLLSGVQQLTSLQAPTGDNVISVQENGKKQYYFVHDAGVMRGIDNVSPNQWIWLMKVLRWPKRVLTRSITLMPDFILKNWFRDIWHTYMLNRSGTVIPVLDSGRGWAKAIAHDDTFKDIISGGGVFDAGFVNASDPDKTNIAIRRALLAHGRHGILDTPKKLKDFYMRIANGAENAHRIIVYEKTLQKTGSRKQALFESRDLMDFSMRGANPVVRFLTETVPFWGARVQGISRTTKGFIENPALTLMRATPIVLASIALYMKNRDDDRYKKLGEYEKRMYYHFYDTFETGDHYMLPKPFEVGAIFSSFPEIITEVMLSNEPDRGKAAIASAVWTITEMLSLWPDVQAVNPAYELMINENRFTGAPILSEWEKQLDPSDQYSYRTNKTIKWLADHMPDSAPDIMKSPKQLEHLARGYLGAGLDYALAASQMMFDQQLNEGVAQPTARWDETPFFKSFKREPEGKYDVYLNNMYDVLAEANKIHNSINLNKKLPKSASRDKRIALLREENKALLYARVRMNEAAKKISTYNKQIRRVYADTKMTPEQKREKIDALLKKRSATAEKVYPYRPGGTLNKYEGGDLQESYWDQLFNDLSEKPKDEQVDELIGAQLPHTATLINDINISEEKLRSAV